MIASQSHFSQILLGVLRASREEQLMLHLPSFLAMIPWCFAYDRHNYARYLPYRCAQMTQLLVEHPDVHAELMQGGFSVQLGSRNPFERFRVDQYPNAGWNKAVLFEVRSCEQVLPNSRVQGHALERAASKYYLAAEYRTMHLRELRHVIGLGGFKLAHSDL